MLLSNWLFHQLRIFDRWRCTISVYVDAYRFHSSIKTTFLTFVDEMSSIHWGMNVSIILDGFMIVLVKDLYGCSLELFEDLVVLAFIILLLWHMVLQFWASRLVLAILVLQIFISIFHWWIIRVIVLREIGHLYRFATYMLIQILGSLMIS